MSTLPLDGKEPHTSIPMTESTSLLQSKTEDDRPKPGQPGYIWRSADYYEADWYNGWDMFMMCFMIGLLVVLLVATYFIHPSIYTQPGEYAQFWTYQTCKFLFMCFVAFLGGLLVTQGGVKVNYTRKIQHFCAYLIPLVTHGHGGEDKFGESVAQQALLQWWGYYFTLLSFTIFIYPIRTRVRIVDIMFASLDRPEDRPHTLSWMSSQVFLGYVIMSVFSAYYTATNQFEAKQLVYIPVIITGIGDGLAEPVGYRWGKHKYLTRGLCSEKSYYRSYEGSACVLISGILACMIWSHYFASTLHFILGIATVPIAMTFAEAFSPHTWDTPFLLTTGCGLLWLITFVPNWDP